MQQITAYRSNSGKTFDTPVEALTDDLRTYLSAISENEAIGAKLTDKIMSSDFEPLCAILTELRAAVAEQESQSYEPDFGRGA